MSYYTKNFRTTPRHTTLSQLDSGPLLHQLQARKNNCKLGLCGMDPQHSLPGIKKTRAANIYIYQYIYRGRKITYIPVYISEDRQSKTQSWHHHLVHLSSLYSSIALIPSIHTFHILTVVGCKTPQSKHRPERTAPDNLPYCSRAMRATENTYESVGEQ